MKIRYLSHACFEIKDGKTLLIDPFFSGNPLAPKYTGKPDLLLATHEHSDHADASFLNLASCPIVCPASCDFKGAEIMKVGERKTVEGVGVEMIPASHVRPPASPSPLAAGFVIEFEGKRVAHLGDTYIEGVKPIRNIDLLFIPIGGHYTMNVDEAIQALRIIKPKLAIPMHYDTFPVIKANPNDFKAKAEKEGFKVRVMKIGEEIEI